MPGYMVCEELQRDNLERKTELRAWGYEKKLEEGGGEELARKCWEEIKRSAKEGRVRSRWEDERRSFYEDRGWRSSRVGE